MSSKSQRTIYSGFSSLSLLLKERQIKIARSDMNKENKERVNSLGHRTCVSLEQRFVALTKQRFAFGMSSRLLLYSQDPRACFSQPQTLVVLPVFSAAHPDIIHLSQQKRNSLSKLPDSSAPWYSWRACMNSFHSFKSFKSWDGPVRFWYITNHLMSSNYLLTDSNHFLFILLNDFEDFRRLRSYHSFCSSL